MLIIFLEKKIQKRYTQSPSFLSDLINSKLYIRFATRILAQDSEIGNSHVQMYEVTKFHPRVIQLYTVKQRHCELLPWLFCWHLQMGLGLQEWKYQFVRKENYNQAKKTFLRTQPSHIKNFVSYPLCHQVFIITHLKLPYYEKRKGATLVFDFLLQIPLIRCHILLLFKPIYP